MSEAQKIAQAVLEELESRKGFDWWWDDLDALVQSEIEQVLTGVIDGILKGPIDD